MSLLAEGAGFGAFQRGQGHLIGGVVRGFWPVPVPCFCHLVRFIFVENHTTASPLLPLANTTEQNDREIRP
jgi:hypothetical protein